MIDGLAVNERVRPRRIVGNHAADGGSIRCGNVRREVQAMWLGRLVEVVEHAARLHARPAFRGVDLQDAIEMLRAIEDDTRSDALTSLRCAAAARGEGDADSTAIPHNL